jgi:predicted ATPase
VDAAAEAAGALLGKDESLRLLTTSREALRVPSEAV